MLIAQVGLFAPDFTAPAVFPGQAGNSPLQTVGYHRDDNEKSLLCV